MKRKTMGWILIAIAYSLFIGLLLFILIQRIGLLLVLLDILIVAIIAILIWIGVNLMEKKESK